MKALPSTAELESPLRWVSDIVRLVGGFLPGALDPWLNGYARAPLRFLVVLAVLTFLLWYGSHLAARIRNDMGLLWGRSLSASLPPAMAPHDAIFRFRTHPLYLSIHYAVKRYVAPAFFALLFAHLGLGLASHALFNVQDYAGLVCRETGKALEIGPGETIHIATRDSARFPLFDTASLCQNMGVKLEQNKRYRITVKAVEPFTDGGIEASRGFYFLDPPRLWQKAFMFVAVPFRRELIRPWFRIVARIGGKGGEETFLDPDPKDGSISEVITATRDGELFLFVNDAVLPVPGLYGFFYTLNNLGKAEVAITQQKPCFVCETAKP